MTAQQPYIEIAARAAWATRRQTLIEITGNDEGPWRHQPGNTREAIRKEMAAALEAVRAAQARSRRRGGKACASGRKKRLNGHKVSVARARPTPK
jgi:hypothetical protein